MCFFSLLYFSLFIFGCVGSELQQLCTLASLVAARGLSCPKACGFLSPHPGIEPEYTEAEESTTEDEMVGWHHQPNEHEFEQAPGVGDGQGGLVCCSPWGHKESDMTER